MAVILGFGVGTLIIAAAIFWGMSQHKRRNRANDAITDAATRELYEHPDRYAEKSHDELQAKTER